MSSLKETTKEIGTELLNIIRGNGSPKRRAITAIPTSSTNRWDKSKHPLITLCFIAGVVFLVLYIVVFNILSQKTRINNHDIFETPEKESQDTALSYSSNILKQSTDEYFSIFNYIHNTPFNELSPELQTRHLQELFRFKIISLIQDRQKKGDDKQSGQGELLRILNELYQEYSSGINFVQIGACDGNWKESNDPIQKLILEKKNWHGVMLEPVPYTFETLKQNIENSIPDWEQRIVAVNAALSDHDGVQTFYIVNEHFRNELPEESHALKYQLGSFNKEHIIKHLKVKKERKQLSQDLDYYIDGIDVTTRTAQSVVNVYKESGKIVRDGTIDVLTIDAEGYDYIVLKGFLKNTAIKPLIVVFEHLHLKPEDKKAAIDMLHEYGYADVQDGWNSIGIRLSNLR